MSAMKAGLSRQGISPPEVNAINFAVDVCDRLIKLGEHFEACVKALQEAPLASFEAILQLPQPGEPQTLLQVPLISVGEPKAVKEN
jgi:hypothetical protein